MLGLCFLVLDKIECEEIWEEWLTGNEDKVLIAIHAKTPFTLRTKVFQERAVFIPTIPTRWGDHSLVEATLGLFQQTATAAHSILLSGTCIPLKPFSVIESTLQPKSYAYAQLNISDARYQRANKRIVELLPLKDVRCKKHQQWIIVYRSHVELLLKNRPRITQIYKGTRFSDESWFLTFMTILGVLDEVILQKTTFTNWTDDDDCHPKTYLEISDEELSELVNTPEYFFGRKFKQNTENLRLLWTNTIQTYNT